MWGCFPATTPGDVVGTTVVGGKGAGSRDDQLDGPAGLFATEDQTFYVADSGNRRVMKWREGWRSGMVVGGGCDDGDGLHQLKKPVDITMDSSGALYIADSESGRVVRWAAPLQA